MYGVDAAILMRQEVWQYSRTCSWVCRSDGGMREMQRKISRGPS